MGLFDGINSDGLKAKDNQLDLAWTVVMVGWGAFQGRVSVFNGLLDAFGLASRGHV